MSKRFPLLSKTPTNPSSFHSLIDSITTFSSQNHLSEAFTSFSLLLRFSPPSPLLLSPLSSLLSSSTSLHALPQGLQLHSLILSLGLLPHPSLLPLLTSFYSSLSRLSDARSLALLSPSPLPWNILISSYSRAGFPKNALSAYRSMAQNAVEPDDFTYPSVLKACADTKDLALGKEIHSHLKKHSNWKNLFVRNALVAMYAKCGELAVARELFDEMPVRDVVSWNSIISGYAAKGAWGEAFGLFERMRAEGMRANSVTWNTIIGGKLQVGRHGEALRLVSQMRWSNVSMDFVTVVIGLNACSRIGCLRLGREIHGVAIRSFCDASESVTNALITMYSRCDNIELAHRLFQRARFRGLITWNCMVAGFAVSDRAEEALMVFRDLVCSGHQPNYVTVVTVLALCARVANLQHGCELHCFITKQGFETYRLIWNSLIDVYSKSGKISIAQRVFDTMTDRDQVSYTSLIAGYGMQGEGTKALKLFDEMIGCGLEPDSISMVAVLSACSHCGLVDEGQVLFDKMVTCYKIEPKMEHFSCMVDLFGRAGQLEKAEEMLSRTPFRPSAAMWASLVGACLVHGNKEIGERAAKRLLEMKTENAGHYVLIANMYAVAGCWEELANVRTMMRDMGVRKAPGCAWADLGNGFHPFLVGDRSSPLAPEIYTVLEGLFEQMRDVGYVVSEELGFEEY